MGYNKKEIKTISTAKTGKDNWLESYQQGGDPTAEQKKWLQSYIQSPMYLERLKLEGFTGDKSVNEQQARFKNVQEAQVHYTKAIAKNPGFISGLYIPKHDEGFHKDFLGIQDEWVPNKYEKDPKKHLDKKGHVYLENEYKPGHRPYPGFETTPIHEFGHSADEGGFRIPKSTIDKIKRLTTTSDNPISKTKGVEFDYENTPTEFINRIQPIRYLLDKSKIYDAKTQKFTDKHYDKMISDPNIRWNTHYQDVMKKLKGSDAEKKKAFIDIMNTIAQSNNQQELSTAKKGGSKDDVIVDPMGQWNHPGKITKIPGNQITMQGVPYPVLGVDNLGNEKMMYPGMDYTFPGESVTEYPQLEELRKGGKKKKLKYSEADRARVAELRGPVSNPTWTNPNMFKPGGWLEQYVDGGEEDFEEYRKGGPLKRNKTSKNIKTSLNFIMARNFDVFGPWGKRFYDPNAKMQYGGWLDKYE